MCRGIEGSRALGRLIYILYVYIGNVYYMIELCVTHVIAQG